MVVTGVVVGSPADRAGLRENDVILKIGGTEAHQLSVLTKVAADTPPGQTVPPLEAVGSFGLAPGWYAQQQCQSS